MNSVLSTFFIIFLLVSSTTTSNAKKKKGNLPSPTPVNRPPPPLVSANPSPPPPVPANPSPPPPVPANPSPPPPVPANPSPPPPVPANPSPPPPVPANMSPPPPVPANPSPPPPVPANQSPPPPVYANPSPPPPVFANPPPPPRVPASIPPPPPVTASPPPPPSPPPLPAIIGTTLALQWPKAVCHRGRGDCDWSKRPLSQNRFTIHGLWPNHAGGKTHRIYTPDPFNAVSVSGVKYISRTWQSFLKSKTNVGFWEHEWLEHGRKQNTIIRGSMLGYFIHTVGLVGHIDIVGALSKSSIYFDDREYDTNTIKTILSTAIGADVYLICYRDSTKSRFGILVEVHICMDPTATRRINCPPANLRNACNTKLTFLIDTI